jgi:hypothetical protein
MLGPLARTLRPAATAPAADWTANITALEVVMTNPSTDATQDHGVGKAGFAFAASLKRLQAVGAATLLIVMATLVLAIMEYCRASTGGPLANRPECPHDTVVWIAGKYSKVPEFHDCQRLIVKSGSGLQYDKLAAVFLGQKVIEGTTSVTFKLDPAVMLLTVQGSGAGGGIRGSGPPIDIVVTISPGGKATLDTTTAVFTPWVEVVAEGTYSSLGINPGYNCMFIVEHKKSDGTVLKTDAKMVSVGTDESCENHKNDLGTTLSVFANAAPPGAAIPAATRWVWSPWDSTQLIGIPCGATWCDVGPHAGPAAVGSAFPQAVKGWYDEQYLADYTGSGLAVSSAVGTVFPEQGLDTRDSAYYSGTFKDVAHVAITAALSKYESRYAFGNAAANGPISSMATIALCYGDREKCPMPTAPASLHCDIITDQMAGLPLTAAIKHPWWARVTSPDGSKVNYFCTGYRGLPSDFKMPAVVRWRWRAKDETVWIPCAQGCCEVDVT